MEQHPGPVKFSGSELQFAGTVRPATNHITVARSMGN
jgi:hypothetical protein